MKSRLPAALAVTLAGTLAFAVPAFADSVGPIDFESYTVGNINGQNGWSATGSAGSGCALYDEGISSNSTITGAPESFGAQSFRISNAVTSGCFGDQAFAPAASTPAGEVGANNGTFGAATPLSHFDASFDIAAIPDSTGDTLSVSRDRGDGARMSYLRFENPGDGMLHVYFDDVQGMSNPANFVETALGTYDASVPHHIEFAMDMNDGPSNDVVKIYVDGTLAHTGTSWENYYRYDAESNPSLDHNYTPTVRTLLLRAGGTAVPANDGKGYLVDNLSLGSSAPVPAACPAGTVKSAAPVETVTVPANSPTPTASVTSLMSGHPYLLQSSGTWANGGLNVADTEFASTDAWSTVMDGYNISPYFLGEGEFDLQVDSSFINWGAYDGASHTYTSLYTGTGAPVALGVFDGDSNTGVANPGWYDDNSGSLAVAVYSCDTPAPPPPATPATKNDCMNNGWKALIDASGSHFKNQGDCVSYVATKGKNIAGGH